MKRMVILLALFSSAAFADLKPVGKVETECNKQANVISQIYEEHRLGFSEQRVVSGHVSDGSSKQSVAWLERVVKGIYSDPNSRFINVTAALDKYESDCVRYPDKFIRDRNLL